MSACPRRVPRPPCVHCKAERKDRSNHRRGLCPGCYGDRAIRKLYPPPAPPPDRGGPCAACGERPGTYRRGLCRPCWSSPAVRALYPKRDLTVYYPPARRRRKAPPWPTDALPGSAEKLLVMRGRAELGQPIFVDGDAQNAADAAVDLSLFGAVHARDLPERGQRLRLSQA